MANLGAFLLSSCLLVLPVSAQSIAFFNESDPDKAYKIPEKDVATIATVTLEVKQPSLVLVQFANHVTTEDMAGRPCSVRAMFRADDGKPQSDTAGQFEFSRVVETFKYEHDRQGMDVSYLFEAAPGKRTYSLVMRQQSGSNKTIELFYPNLQAIAFPK